ncbi:MAG: recombinase family protein [Oscillospiraceae bacterium]|jgi:hypothetical protein|nr:recombinase family protein [Oscillospiraceae bacterium]
MPFKSILNEYYAKDISKKIRSAKRTMALAEKHISGHPPFGYMLFPDNKYKLIIDEEEAALVRRIFNMAVNGMGYYRISNTFYKEKIPTPAAYTFARTGRWHRGCDNARMCCWSLNAVRGILSNPVCLGHMVNDRITAKSYKTKKLVVKLESDWIIVQNTHEPLIDQKFFE